MFIQSLKALKGRILLLMGGFRAPQPIPRSDSELKILAGETRGLALYFNQKCPISLRTCRFVRHLNLPLEFRNIRRSQVYRDDLVSSLGRLDTPCLKVAEEGRVNWVCGEDRIHAYLESRFAPPDSSRAA